MFLVSDTHFFHQNIIRYCGRPFASVDEMNHHMMERWNSVVNPSDTIYHLGDVYFGRRVPVSDIDKLLRGLNGRKHLILGNHDSGKDQLLQKHFETISFGKLFKDRRLVLSHIPLHPMYTSIGGREFLNVHGHIHEKESPEGRYKNVSVEAINYTPINIEELNFGWDSRLRVIQKIHDPPGSVMYQVTGFPDFIGDKGFSEQHIDVTKERYNIYAENKSGEVQHFVVSEAVYNSTKVGDIVDKEVLSVTTAN